jgi:cell division protein ZipA
MELTIRDWMVIVGVLLIVAVLLDAWRRVRSEKYSRVKMNLIDAEEIPPEPEINLAQYRELPNGGARVVQRSDLVRPGVELASRDAAEDSDLLAGLTSDGPAAQPSNLDWLDQVGSVGNGTAEEQPGAGKLPRQTETEVFMLNVVARDPQGFSGGDILHILLACDLRFGDMNFFHRHEYEAGRGAIQFSVANMMKPGVFDIDNMAQMKTPGLVFFLTLPGPDDMMQAYDYMLETARAQIRELERRLMAQAR